MSPGDRLLEAMRQRLEASLPPTVPAANPADCELAKLKFILDSLTERLAKTNDEIVEINESQTHQLASMAREKFWDSLALPDEPPLDASKLPGSAEAPPKLKRRQQRKPGLKIDRDEAWRIKRLVASLPSDTVVQMLTAKQLAELKSAKPLRQLNSQLQRCQHRAEQLAGRIAETKEEIRRLTLYGNTVFVEEQLEPGRRQATSEAFIREQSLLYQKLHPAIDLELNIDLVEEALQDINGHLITKQEMQYVYHILKLPARTRVNFRLFSVIAALSEKVVQLEPIIRKMVNKMNFDALDYKLEKCKEMFFLLDDLDDKAPTGSITVDSLAVELLAGNLKDEHIGSVIKKFNREKKGYIDFLDYLTYVPLFLEIHERIVSNPLNSEAAY